MPPGTVPDYFQEETEEALRQQVQWLIREVGVDDSFFARLLRVDENAFADWRSSRAALIGRAISTLRNFWHMSLHLLSFYNCEEGRLRNLHGHPVPARGAWRSRRWRRRGAAPLCGRFWRPKETARSPGWKAG